MEKPIQIVDENDRITGSASISEARRRGLYHRIVRVMVEDESGRVLLQKRSSKMLSYPNCWSNSAAGHVDAGESYEDAASRELAEESGLQSLSLEEVGSYRSSEEYRGEQINRFNKVYKTVVSPQQHFESQPKEVAELRWLTRDEMGQLVQDNPEQIDDGLRDVVERYYR